MKNLDQFINELFEDLTPKQRKVLIGRFGLKNGKRSTLQEIGDELGITRERVRQIEEQTIAKIRADVRDGLKELVDESVAKLAKTDGIRRDAEFIAEVKKDLGADDVKHLDHKLHFVFVTAGAPLYRKEDDNTHAYWHTDKETKEKHEQFVKQALKHFKDNDKNAVLRERSHEQLCKDFSSPHVLLIPKHFGQNVFGDIGLREWAEIEPKTIRDKAYLVLKKHGQPLHFSEVAKMINEFGLDKKKAHVQTAHNELIKDDRFVLVGRGMYGLKEHGFEAGTVRDVISSLLKKHGPLSSTEVVTLVNKQRFLKENTILLSLQNRKFFSRLGDGKYSIKEA